MSSSPGTREVAYRLFAAEFDDASLSYSESDEERAPNYVVTPTGARVNRLFVAGVLTEVESVNEDTLRARIVDPSGAFVTYAGQYQPDEQAFLDAADAPEFVALTGKARTFEPEDSDRVYTSVRPESVNAVDADTRDRWIVTAAETTLDRLAIFRKALESDLRGDDLRAALEAGGAPPTLAAGIPRALDHYDTSPAYVEAIRQLAVDALELVAGDRDEVRSPEIGPNESGSVAIGPLPETDVTVAAAAATANQPEAATATEPAEETATEPEEELATEPEEETAAVTETADESATAAATPEDPEGAAAASEASPASETEPRTEPEPTVDAEPAAESAAEADDESEPALGTEASTDEARRTDADDGSDEDDDVLGDFDASDDLGNFDDGEDSIAEDDGTDAAEGTPGVSGEMYEMDEEERREIEAEFDTGFSTGTEIDEPGEADIDVPDPEELAEGTAEGGPETEPDDEAETEPDDEAETAAGTETETDDESEAEPDDESAVEPDDAVESGEAAAEAETDASDVDLESAVVDVMEDLDDGDGAARDAVVSTTVERYGADPDDVRDAIQDALMSGKCYEPGEDALKAI